MSGMRLLQHRSITDLMATHIVGGLPVLMQDLADTLDAILKPIRKLGLMADQVFKASKVLLEQMATTELMAFGVLMALRASKVHVDGEGSRAVLESVCVTPMNDSVWVFITIRYWGFGVS